MPSEPESDSTVDPAVEPEASELEDGPAISATICPLGSVMTDLCKHPTTTGLVLPRGAGDTCCKRQLASAKALHSERHM